MKKDICNALLSINNFLKEGAELTTDLSLGTGELGEILYLFEVSRFFKSNELQELAFGKLEKIHDEIERVSVYNSPDLYSGYTGLAWLYQYLMAEKIVEYDESITTFFDELIMEQIVSCRETENIDLMYGIVGYGVYLLECTSKNKSLLSTQLNSVVDILFELSCRKDNMLFWVDKEFEGMVNLGMAHGVAGIAIFLAKVYVFNGSQLARKMVEESLNWLMTIESKNNKDLSVFSNIYDFQEKTNFNSRVAWCNGDLGIGFSLSFCGKMLNLPKIYREGLRILNRTSLRREQSNSFVYDKGFCHGSSGVFYIYDFLVDEYRLEQFTQTKLFWLKKVLKESSSKETFFSLNVNQKGEKVYLEERGLLNGYAGIGLSLLSSITHNRNWSRILLL